MKVVRLTNLIMTRVIMDDDSIYCKIDGVWYSMFAGVLELMHYTENLEQALQEYINNEFDS